MKTTRTDNKNPRAKIMLRAHFLRRYHADQQPLVFDACQGDAMLWTQLRQEFDIRYWGVDVKRSKGRLAVRSERVLAQAGWDFDVIDVDTYGQPWTHWLALLPHVHKPTTVFLTLGVALLNNSVRAAEHCGIRFKRRIPTALSGFVQEIILDHMWDEARRAGLQIVELREAVTSSRTRYFGLRLEPGG